MASRQDVLDFREQIDKINSIKVPYKEDTPMENNYPEIRELLQQKADYQARLNLLPYDGSPEIKEQGGKQYLYIRKRIASRLTSEYVDVYSDTLYQTLLRNAREARELKSRSGGSRSSWLSRATRNRSCPTGSY